MSDSELREAQLSGSCPLRVAFSVYRGNPTSGGQGVYTKYLSRELQSLGHHVEVFSGQPYPEVDFSIRLTEVPSLDLYRPDDPFRIPKLREFRNSWDLMEFAIMCTGGFPEPRIFGKRLYSLLSNRRPEFDILHDNQSLSWSILRLQAQGWPVVASIHHPITVDKKLGLDHADGFKEQFGVTRFYGFVRMQTKVANRLDHIITVSDTSARDISREMGIGRNKMRVVPVGVDPTTFRPIPDQARQPGLIVTTASADVPLKGLAVLVEAMQMLVAGGERPIVLKIMGQRRDDSPVQRSVERLGLSPYVEFLGKVTQDEMVRLYSSASVAVVPSLYEGFSLPTIEAMACGAPLVVSDGGALPEVAGADGDCARVVRAGDARALASAVSDLLHGPESAERMAHRAIIRARSRFSWRAAALGTVDRYLEALDGSPQHSAISVDSDFGVVDAKAADL